MLSRDFKLNDGQRVIVPIGCDMQVWDPAKIQHKIERTIVKVAKHNFGIVQFGSLHDGFTYVDCPGVNREKYRTDQLIPL